MTIVEDDEVSLSSSSSESSEDSEASSVAESVNEIEADDPCEKYWRQGICCGLVAIGIIVLFTTLILVVNQDYDHFDSSVSLPRVACLVLRKSLKCWARRGEAYFFCLWGLCRGHFHILLVLKISIASVLACLFSLIIL